MLFPLGQVVATPAALEFLEQHGLSPLVLLSRHATGDWGDLDPEDVQANEGALMMMAESAMQPAMPFGEVEAMSAPIGDLSRNGPIAQRLKAPH